jgi:hypothetical protein
MTNMSYCRFENTANDLEDCLEHFGDDITSQSEISARHRIIDMAREIVSEYGDD